MIIVHRFKKRGMVEGSLTDLQKSHGCWAECINPSAKELADISEKAKIPLTDLQEVLDKDERPKVADLEHYSLIIIREPLTKNHAIKTTPISIFLSKKKNNIITITLSESDALDRLKELVRTEKVDVSKNGLSFFVYRLIDEVINDFFHIMDDLEEKIDHVEERVVNTPEKVSVKNIFSIKKTLIFFHKALVGNREVLAAIDKEYVAHIDKKTLHHFRTSYEDLSQLIDTEGTYRDILTGTLEIYLSSVSNNMNKVMKTLTVGASFILIPTLISGIYGMNFNPSIFNMPELYWKYGYFFALGFMGLSVILSYWFFKRKGWI
ncbi:magnesium/cobalt transporter CorA [Candidatus Woesearchaeota archaeon]|nr:magnesium/cobalt transporter CorA [Candidatus Woesearchaeota archaeon]